VTGAKPDQRLHAWREDLADERLKDKLEAPAYSEGTAAQITVAVCNVHGAPAADARLVTQALMGETARVFETRDGWSWVQLDGDGYVGYVREDELAAAVETPTHKIIVPSTLRFSRADIKSQPATMLPLNARLCAVDDENGFLRLARGGFVFVPHCAGLSHAASDWVSVAEQFLGTPYLWGGKSVAGIDCSGLVQVSLQAAGRICLRDSDMQETSLGTEFPEDAKLQRGDLIFWQGHVGIMRDATMLLHANAHHLMVASEPVEEAVERIAAKGSEITMVRRLQ
jgi:cell wall-associated NlpC family hydrolase